MAGRIRARALVLWKSQNAVPILSGSATSDHVNTLVFRNRVRRGFRN
jgi:hypothetical protein